MSTTDMIWRTTLDRCGSSSAPLALATSMQTIPVRKTPPDREPTALGQSLEAAHSLNNYSELLL